MNVTDVQLFVLSQTPVVCKRDYILFALVLFLLASGGVQRILHCVFVLFVLFLSTLLFWIVHFGLPLRYSQDTTL